MPALFYFAQPTRNSRGKNLTVVIPNPFRAEESAFPFVGARLAAPSDDLTQKSKRCAPADSTPDNTSPFHPQHLYRLRKKAKRRHPERSEGSLLV
jgi:hypothetical protein